MREGCSAALVLVLCVACGSTDPASPEQEDAGRAPGLDAAPSAARDSGGDATAASDARSERDAARSSSDGSIASMPPDNPCADLTASPDQDLSGYAATVYTWRDAKCASRSAAMVANDKRDPTGKWGGYMRRYTYQVDGGTRTCTGENDTHPGFGFVVSHWGNTATVGHGTRGTFARPLTGKHHAIHRYNWKDMSIQGQPVNVTVDWLFATGRDHPLWTITYDLSALEADAVQGDTRSPYGDIAWDGGGGNAVAGVGWGDRYRFRSLDAPVSLQSGWDYTQPNTIPHAMEWSVTPDAEMGLVQTQTYLQHDGGGYWSYSRWGMRDEDGPMPEDWNWTYQLNQYELPFTNASKRLSWGSNYGAVGKRSYPAYGDDRQLTGWPYQSYSVFVVLGKHSTATVEGAVADMESVQAASVSATVGSLAREGPAGVARTDSAPYAPAGWDHVYAAWTLSLEGGKGELTLRAPQPLRHPLFHVKGASDVEVSLDGVALMPDVDFYASSDARDGSTWVTLAHDLTGDHTLSFD